MDSTLVVLLVGIGCLVVGVGLGYWFAKSDKDLQASKVTAAENALSEYRTEVGEHFEKTARHFEAIGREYRDLFEHVVSGADKLLEAEDSSDNPFLRIAAPTATVTAAAASTDTEDAGDTELADETTAAPATSPSEDLAPVAEAEPSSTLNDELATTTDTDEEIASAAAADEADPDAAAVDAKPPLDYTEEARPDTDTATADAVARDEAELFEETVPNNVTLLKTQKTLADDDKVKTADAS